jgi:hypothetical protein
VRVLPPYFRGHINKRDREDDRLPFPNAIRPSVSSPPRQKNSALNLITQDTIAPDEQLGKGDDVCLGGDTGGAADGRVDAERLAHDGVEVCERVELVHRRHVVRRCLELGAEPPLYLWVAREREESLGRCCRDRLVPFWFFVRRRVKVSTIFVRLVLGTNEYLTLTR